MGIFLTIVILLASVLLILLVLMQNPKGGGLSTDFGSAHQLGGVKQTNDFIENATWSLAGIIGVLSIIMTLMYSEPRYSDVIDDTTNTEQTMPQEQPSTPPQGEE